MKLIEMNQEEFDQWAPRSRNSYAQDKVRANGFTERESLEIAEKDFLRLLPDGLRSKDNFLFSMKNDANINVGYIWFSIRGSADNRKAFICDIIVEETYRGQGLGRKAMILVEEEVKKNWSQ